MRFRVKPSWRLAFLGLLVLLVVAGVVLWRAPTDEYVFVPDRIRAVEPLVQIDGEDPTARPNGHGVYMVDILVRQATLAERLFPFARGDGTLVPQEAFNPEGIDEAQKAKADALVMSKSQDTAAAVALKALGYDVVIDRSGAEVALVLPGSPAEVAKLEPGDVIIAADGKPVDGPEALRDALTGIEPGTTVPISVRRNGSVRVVRIGTRAAEYNAYRAVMGVQVDQAATITLPVRVSIDAQGVGGPSAGLAFALDILDELGTEVDRGRTVVVTGELALDGAVLPVGGIHQKTIAARNAGADVFLVPAGNASEAKRYAGALPIVSVTSFHQALVALGVTLPTAA